MLRYVLLMALLVCIVLVFYIGFFQKSATEDRLNRIRELSASTGTETDAEGEKRKNRAVRTPPVPEKVKKMILSAGVMLRVEEFMMIWLSATFLPALFVFVLTFNPLFALLAMAAGAVLPMVYLNAKKKKRREAFGTQLGDALMLVANGLRAGFSFEQVLETVAREMPDPISGEFARVNREMKMGMTLESSFNALTERMESTDMRLLTSALLIQRQVGGNLAEILDTICITIQDRIRIKNSIKTMTGQGRISGIIVGVIPVALFFLVSAFNPEYMQMFFDTVIGKVLLGVAVGMELLGFVVIRKMIDIVA